MAKQLTDNGWDVQADLQNFERPDPIGNNNRIPDIHATRGHQTKIIEVETPNTVDSHHEQHTTFRRSTGQKENTEFELIVKNQKKS